MTHAAGRLVLTIFFCCDDISRCKVQSGGKDIKAAIDAGEQLLVISID